MLACHYVHRGCHLFSSQPPVCRGRASHRRLGIKRYDRQGRVPGPKEMPIPSPNALAETPPSQPERIRTKELCAFDPPVSKLCSTLVKDLSRCDSVALTVSGSGERRARFSRPSRAPANDLLRGGFDSARRHLGRPQLATNLKRSACGGSWLRTPGKCPVSSISPHPTGEAGNFQTCAHHIALRPPARSRSRSPQGQSQWLTAIKEEGLAQHELSLIAAVLFTIWPLVRPKLSAPSRCWRQLRTE